MDQIKTNTIAININRDDLFQLHLCVLNRLGSVQQLYANAFSAEMQNGMQTLINYLSGLDNNILKILEQNNPQEEPKNDEPKSEEK